MAREVLRTMLTHFRSIRKISTLSLHQLILISFALISGTFSGALPAEAQTESAVSASPSPRPTVKPTPPKPSPTPTPVVLEGSRKFPKAVNKLIVDDLQKGRGRASKPGSRLVLHFQAWLYDPTQPLGRGPQFESTLGKAPYKFTLQNPETPHIKGWEDGLLEMKVGGKRRLIIPPDLGYGQNGAGAVIPAGATLMYEVQLIDVE